MSDIKISRTQKALRLIQDEGITAKEAAERVGITTAAVSKGKCHPSKTQQKINMLSEMQEEIESLRQQLAASQAREQQLQDALRELLCYNEKSTWIGGVENGYSVPVGSAKLKVISHCEEILSIPSDTTALESMITKAGEVMRERAIKSVNLTPYRLVADERIRALPPITLEDLSK